MNIFRFNAAKVSDEKVKYHRMEMIILENQKYQVTLSKPIYSYYTIGVTATSEEDAIEKVQQMLDNRKISESDLCQTDDEPDYDVDDDPSAYSIVDATEENGENEEDGR